MSLPNRPIPGSPAEWLMRARADLALAKAPLPPGAVYEDLCFHAQQAAGKAIKAVYRKNDWMFRYTHDLKELLAELRNRGLFVPDNLEDTVILTHYAHQLRYPCLAEPVTTEEYEEALVLAERVVEWATKLVEEHPG